MNIYIRILVLMTSLVSGSFMEIAAQSAQQFSLDSAYLCQPFSAMDIMSLTNMGKNVDNYKDLPGYADYKEKIVRVTEYLSVYDRAVKTLESPFDFSRIVELRKTLIPLITDEGSLSEAQFAEMDRLDVLLSRYKGSVLLFRRIIDSINGDPVVTAYRAASRDGRPSSEERRRYISAISAVVYKPSTREFTDEINSYIRLIPYLKPRLTEYLNSIAQYPDTTPGVETEITSIKL